MNLLGHFTVRRLLNGFTMGIYKDFSCFMLNHVIAPSLILYKVVNRANLICLQQLHGVFSYTRNSAPCHFFPRISIIIDLFDIIASRLANFTSRVTRSA